MWIIWNIFISHMFMVYTNVFKQYNNKLINKPILLNAYFKQGHGYQIVLLLHTLSAYTQ